MTARSGLGVIVWIVAFALVCLLIDNYDALNSAVHHWLTGGC